LQQQHKKKKRKENKNIKSGKKPPKKQKFVSFLHKNTWWKQLRLWQQQRQKKHRPQTPCLPLKQQQKGDRARESERKGRGSEREREDARVQRAALNAREIGRERHTHPGAVFFLFFFIFNFFRIFWGDIVG
jgi:hypothetical protein